jgi:hypothetical protein
MTRARTVSPRPRGAQIRDWLVLRARRARAAVAAGARRVLVLLTVFAGLGLIVAGIALIFVPAGLIATGLALFAALTFDPASVRKLTWPR